MTFKFNPFTDKLDIVGTVGGVGTVITLTGNSGGAINPDGAGNINVVGSGNITVAGTGTTLTISETSSNLASNYTGVNHATGAPYVVLSTDYYISCDVTGGVITINLPNAPTTKRLFVMKDKVGLAATSNITITTVGGAVNIDGATSYVMATNYQSIQLIFNGTSYEVF